MLPQDGTAIETKPFYGPYYADIAASKADDLAELGEVLAGVADLGRILDLCGGFGRVAISLSRRGLQVTVVDQSEAMIALGRDLAAQEGFEVEFLTANVTRPLDQLPLGWFSAVICMHHALNEVLDDLDAVMDNVAQALEAGGLAIFHLLPETPYNRPHLWEDLDLDGSVGWKVQTLVEPLPGAGDQLHRLRFRYSHASGEVAPFEASVQRRVWTVATTAAAAAAAGLVPLGRRGRLLIYAKPS